MKINFFYSFLDILTIISILSALAVITSTNAVLSIIYLILVFINAAIYLILIGLGFIGISYIIVYIGAITILFLFVIMMISTDILGTIEIGSEFSKLLPLAYTIAVFFLTLFILFVDSGQQLQIFNFNLSNFFTNENLLLFNTIINEEHINSEGITNNLFNKITLNSLLQQEYISVHNLQDYVHLNTSLININSAGINVTDYSNYNEIKNILSLQTFANFSSEIVELINNLSIKSGDITNLNFFQYYPSIVKVNNPESIFSPILQIEILGQALYGYSSFVLILSSYLLLVAMICPIILTHNNKESHKIYI